MSDKKPFLIFDLDGTLRNAFSNKYCPNSPLDQCLIPGVKDHLQKLRKEGADMFGASNQGGVALGHFSQYIAWMTAAYTNDLLGHVLKDIKLAFYHKDGRYRERYPIHLRKPNPGMLLELIEDYYNPDDYDHPVFIGDGFTDEEAAKNAKIVFVFAHEFFGFDAKETDFGFEIVYEH